MSKGGHEKLRKLIDEFDLMASEFIIGLDLDEDKLKKIAHKVAEYCENDGDNILDYIGATFILASASMETVGELMREADRLMAVSEEE